MIDAIHSYTPSDQSEPIAGFGDISPLGCAFAAVLQAFTTMYLSMQEAGIIEAKVSTSYNQHGIELTDQKETMIQKLRTQENYWEYLLAHVDLRKDPKDATKYEHELQLVQAEEGQVKSLIGSYVSQAQTAGANASNEFTGALKGMNDLFDCARDGLNTVVGTALQIGNTIANQH